VNGSIPRARAAIVRVNEPMIHVDAAIPRAHGAMVGSDHAILWGDEAFIGAGRRFIRISGTFPRPPRESLQLTPLRSNRLTKGRARYP
jgi:hypothetical protein